MFRAFLSDDGESVVIFHADEDEPEVMSTADFAAIYGREMLPETQKVEVAVMASEKETGAVSYGEEAGAVPEDGTDAMLAEEKSEATEVPADDVAHYWRAFRRLTKNCGQYAHKTGLQRNVEAGVMKVQKVAYDYYGGVGSDRRLDHEIAALDNLRQTAVANLDYWSRRVGFKPMSTPEDVKTYQLKRRADTEILVEYLTEPKFRKKAYQQIDKYARKGELKSPAEVTLEVLKLLQKNSNRNKPS